MDGFRLMAVKAAQLKKASDFGGGPREGETGLGLPKNVPANLRPLTPQELASLTPHPPAPGGGPVPGPVARGGLDRVLAALRTGKGRAGVLGAGAATVGGMGYGLHKRLMRPDPVEPAGQPTARVAARETVLDRTKGAVGGFLQRMKERYRGSMS